MLRLAIVYDSGKRYILPFEVAQKVLKLTEEDIKRLTAAVKKEIQTL